MIDPPGWYSVSSGSVSLRVKARPGAGRDAILGIRAGELVVAVRAPAERGRANAGIVQVLSDALGVPRDSVVLRTGGAFGHKVFQLPLDAAGALRKLEKEL